MEAYKKTRNLASRKQALHTARNLLRSLQSGDNAFFDRLEASVATFVIDFLCRQNVPAKIPAVGSISAESLAQSLSGENSVRNPPYTISMLLWTLQGGC